MMYPKPTRVRPPGLALVQGVAVSVGKLRVHVILRDDGCILRKIGFATEIGPHECRGRWQDPVGSTNTGPTDFTLEHVPAVHGPTDVRRDDDEHCVGLCYATNIRPPSTREREAMRRHLRDLFPNCSADG